MVRLWAFIKIRVFVLRETDSCATQTPLNIFETDRGGGLDTENNIYVNFCCGIAHVPVCLMSACGHQLHVGKLEEKFII